MIQPVGHFVLVKLWKFEEKIGSIYVPETAREVHQKAVTKGIIKGIGPQAWVSHADGSPWAAVGDTVLFPRYAGMPVDAEAADGEEDLVLMNDDDVKCVIKEN